MAAGNYAQAARRYRQMDVAAAPPAEILTRLFQRCLRDIDEATTAVEEQDIKARAKAIDHAFRIVAELRAALDASVSPELCENLEALYDFALQELTEANSRPDTARLANARTVIASLAESFAAAQGAS